jgi:hypothetical protein
MALEGTCKIEIPGFVKGDSCWRCCDGLSILIDVAIIKVCLANFGNSVSSGDKVENCNKTYSN